MKVAGSARGNNFYVMTVHARTFCFRSCMADDAVGLFVIGMWKAFERKWWTGLRPVAGFSWARKPRKYATTIYFLGLRKRWRPLVLALLTKGCGIQPYQLPAPAHAGVTAKPLYLNKISDPKLPGVERLTSYLNTQSVIPLHRSS